MGTARGWLVWLWLVWLREGSGTRRGLQAGQMGAAVDVREDDGLGQGMLLIVLR